MKTKMVNTGEHKTYVVVFDKDEEVISGLENFAEENNLTDSHLTAIGAFRKVTLAYFDMDKKEYINNEIREQVEVVSLIGNISRFRSKPKVHIHTVVGKRNGNAMGGHLKEGIVRPTLEIVLTESPVYLHREMDEETGLPLIKI